MEGAPRVSITTIAVLTHLSLSFIAQFDIKRHDIQSSVVHELSHGDDFLIALP